MAQRVGPRSVPAGSKAPNGRSNGQAKVVDAMDPKVPLLADGFPILAGDRWRGAYMLYDLAAELWLEETSGKHISYFEPESAELRPTRDTLLWFVAGLRDWHEDGVGKHSDEDDLKVQDLVKVLTRSNQAAIGWVANRAWAENWPKEMRDLMLDAVRTRVARQKDLVLAALRDGKSRDAAIEAGGATMQQFYGWLIDAADPGFRDAVQAAETGSADDRADTSAASRTAPENGTTEDTEADPLDGRGGSETGQPPGSPSGSVTTPSGG